MMLTRRGSRWGLCAASDAKGNKGPRGGDPRGDEAQLGLDLQRRQVTRRRRKEPQHQPASASALASTPTTAAAVRAVGAVRRRAVARVG